MPASHHDFKINWVPWVRNLSVKKAWTLIIVPIVILVIAFVFRIVRGHNVFDPDWFLFCFSLYFVWTFSPAGEQLNYRVMPKSKPHYAYQLTTWSQWRWAVIMSVAFFVISMLIWPPLKQAWIAAHMMGSVLVGFILMWAWRWWRVIRRYLKNKNR
ncbi:hypothetical protein [Eupransor demetentiae]|uniref:Uncharacterized protein n=1 Tax=Eupransor demetentiae TaxID=3109584 RepID=A0ABM9N5B9_9LACO|nr:hypothetical protein R54876_GBNLAHCA_00938 [Lactobacillaceae bacterium LMG 33000]